MVSIFTWNGPYSRRFVPLIVTGVPAKPAHQLRIEPWVRIKP